jgi:hypothetical protein
MVRKDESIEEELRHARTDAETARKRAAEAAAEAAEATVRAEALQQTCWQLAVAVQRTAGEKAAALQELVDATIGHSGGAWQQETAAEPV